MPAHAAGEASDAIDPARAAAAAAAPVVWLLGKAQAGKTSIISELTGQARSGIGNGFQRATLHSQLYDFPPDLPAVRFLDTRGLEDERGYDPSEDLAFAETRAHLLLVVVRAEDSALDRLLTTLRTIRKRHRDWPLLVCQTRPHDLYPPGTNHPQPYPFQLPEWPAIPEALDLSLRTQRRAFADLPGQPPVFAVVDFTPPESGFFPHNYGADALWDALQQLLPQAHERLNRKQDPADLARLQVILPWAFAAAGADAVPAPLIGGLASSGLQARMVCAVAARFHLQMTAGLWQRFVKLLGAAFALRYAARFLLRQGLKMIPGAGTAAVALWSFGITYALGEAAIYFSREVAAGREPDQQTLRQTYTQNLQKAREIWQQRAPRRPSSTKSAAEDVKS